MKQNKLQPKKKIKQTNRLPSSYTHTHTHTVKNWTKP